MNSFAPNIFKTVSYDNSKKVMLYSASMSCFTRFLNILLKLNYKLKSLALWEIESLWFKKTLLMESEKSTLFSFHSPRTDICSF